MYGTAGRGRIAIVSDIDYDIDAIVISRQLRLLADTVGERLLVEMCDEADEAGSRCGLAPGHVGRHVTRDGRNHWLEE